jgi:hypothetical protein
MAELVDEQVRATTLGTAVLRRLGAPTGTTQRDNGFTFGSGSVNNSGVIRALEQARNCAAADPARCSLAP